MKAKIAVCSVYSVMLMACLTANGADGKEGLDLNSMENTAVYLRKVWLQSKQYEHESGKTGNNIKRIEYAQSIEKELASWKRSKITWLVPVHSVTIQTKKEGGEIIIAIPQVFQFGKDKSAQIAVRLGMPTVLQDENESIDWAKRLKRGDTVLLEGRIKAVSLTKTNQPWHAPEIELANVVFSKHKLKAKR